MMTLSIRPLNPEFAGKVSGVDITRPLSRYEVDAIEAGMDRYAGTGVPRSPPDRR